MEENSTLTQSPSASPDADPVEDPMFDFNLAELLHTSSEGDLAFLQWTAKQILQQKGPAYLDRVYEIAQAVQPGTPPLKELLAWDRSNPPQSNSPSSNPPDLQPSSPPSQPQPPHLQLLPNPPSEPSTTPETSGAP